MKLGQLKYLYPDLFTSAVVPVAKALSQVFKTHRNYLTEEIAKMVYYHRVKELAIVLKKACTSHEQRALSNQLKYVYDITFFTEAGFRNNLESYSHAFFIGTPAYYGDWASNCLKADTTYFVSYDMFTSKIVTRSVIPNQLPKGHLVSTIGKNIEYDDGLEKSFAIDIEQLQYSAKEAVQRVLADQAENESSNMQSVEASTIHLENERFIFVSKDSKIRTFLPNITKDFVKQIPFQDLEEDSFIIIRNERDSKLIAEVADQEVLKADAPLLRAMQVEWKQSLNKMVGEGGITRTALHLSRQGMTTASPTSLRIWCGEESICPQELPHLLSILGYDKNEVEKIHLAMRKIHTAHISAGRYITNKLMSELTSDISLQLLEKGWCKFTSKQLNGASFNIERVVTIDHSKHSVMPYNLMKLFSFND
ncbi:DISARM anti-phage system protein DrmE domain-containing protein [Paenibacillus dakarensis]|uniref:DISARM anti-phage system protein DrmE domain-containing protein n=1 Tax=Paenibacillus dakarensis TaxID=1527293 RepID=UPI0012E23912|nr:hypothetical protein [Paenibacillus dakarensis]